MFEKSIDIYKIRLYNVIVSYLRGGYEMAVSKDTNKDKDKALEQVLNDIEKQFGKGSIMKLGENKHMKVDVVSSGIYLLMLH